MASLALFNVNADGLDRGFDATPGATLNLALRSSSGVSSVAFQVWDAASFSSSLSIAQNPPFKSKGAPDLTLVGATSGTMVSPTTLLGNVTVTMPANIGLGSWIIRCIVNGGFKDGLLFPDYIHERMIVLRTNDQRLPVATERQQYEVDGIAGCLVDAIGNPAIATFTSAGSTFQTVSTLDYAVPDGKTVDVIFTAIGFIGAEYGKFEIHGSYTNVAGGTGTVEDWQTQIGGSPKRLDVVWDAKIVLTGDTLNFQVKANGDNPNWRLKRVVTVESLP